MLICLVLIWICNFFFLGIFLCERIFCPSSTHTRWHIILQWILLLLLLFFFCWVENILQWILDRLAVNSYLLWPSVASIYCSLIASYLHHPLAFFLIPLNTLIFLPLNFQLPTSHFFNNPPIPMELDRRWTQFLFFTSNLHR